MMDSSDWWRNLLQEAASRLKEAGVDDPVRESWALWTEATGIPLKEWYLERTAIHAEAVERFWQMVDRRSRREPFAYVVGHKEFFGLDLVVDASVLVPRPETELLVQTVLDRLRMRQGESLEIVDVGTGSGAIAIAVAHYGSPNWTIYGVDLSSEALCVAQENGRRLKSRVRFVQGRYVEPITTAIDVVVANLPYIDPDQASHLDPELAYEPWVALYSNRGGLQAFQELLVSLDSRLAERGWIFLEVGAGQAEMVSELFRQGGFSVEPPISDYSGIPRVLMVKK